MDEVLVTHAWPSEGSVNAWATRQNERHRAFWEAKMRDVERQITDPVVSQEAFKHFNGEIARLLPIQCQTPIEYLLENAESYRSRVLNEQASKGGQARKQDQLQNWIESFVRQRPDASPDDLVLALRAEAPGPLIVEVEEDDISFKTGRGEELKVAKISGLKHRMSRARIKIRSQ